MEDKNEKCEKCIYNSDSDMGMWHEGDFEDAPKPEEEKLKYLPIRWLIRKLIKHNVDDCAIWFNGISRHPRGTKQEEDIGPAWLYWLFPFVYVDQWRDGGITGDDFAGNLYYRLFPFCWLVFYYEC